MARLEKIKRKKLQRALLVTSRARGCIDALQGYRPRDKSTFGKLSQESHAYRLGYDLGLTKQGFKPYFS